MESGGKGMKAKHIFSVLAGIHILIGMALCGMLLNPGELLKNMFPTLEFDPIFVQLIVGQIRVVIVHSLGAGFIMLMARGITNASDAKRILRGYCIFGALVLLNATYGALFATMPPIPVVILYIVGFALAAYGSAKATVE